MRLISTVLAFVLLVAAWPWLAPWLQARGVPAQLWLDEACGVFARLWALLLHGLSALEGLLRRH